MIFFFAVVGAGFAFFNAFLTVFPTGFAVDFFDAVAMMLIIWWKRLYPEFIDLILKGLNKFIFGTHYPNTAA